MAALSRGYKPRIIGDVQMKNALSYFLLAILKVKFVLLIKVVIRVLTQRE